MSAISMRTALSLAAAVVLVAAAVFVAHTPPSKAVRHVAWRTIAHSQSLKHPRHGLGHPATFSDSKQPALP
jgi:hypothetical protein